MTPNIQFTICRDEDHPALSSSSSAFSASSDSSSTSSSSHFNTSFEKNAQHNHQQNIQSQPPSQQFKPTKPLSFSPSMPINTPPIPPRAPGRVASVKSIRLLEHEKSIASGMNGKQTAVSKPSQQQESLRPTPLSESSEQVTASFHGPVYGARSFTSQSTSQLPLAPLHPLNPIKPKNLQLTRSSSLSTNISKVIQPVAPLDIGNKKEIEEGHEINKIREINKIHEHINVTAPTPPTPPKHSSPPIPPARAQAKLSVFKLQQLRLHSLGVSHKHELSPAVLEKLPRWIVSSMIIQQESDSEPDLKIMQPCVNFSDEDFRIICFSAIPDKHSFNPILNSSSSTLTPLLNTYSQFHTFRFQPSLSSQIPEPNQADEVAGSPNLSNSNSNSKELFGFTLYTCRPHPSSSSNKYIQESIVILSYLNYPHLFSACLQLIYDVTQQNSQITPSPFDQVSAITTTTNTTEINPSRHSQLQPPLPLNNTINSPSHDHFLDKLLSAKLPVLQSALKNISQWPDPKPNSTLELGFLSTIINISIPHYESVPLLGTVDLDTSSVGFHSNGRNFHKIDSITKPVSTLASENYKNTFSYSSSDITLGNAYNNSSSNNTNNDDSNNNIDSSSFSSPEKILPINAPVISASEPAGTWDFAINYISDFNDLYLLYEYVLLGKPIVIYAQTPHMCSSFISLLIDLIRPIPYGGRVREYVTAESVTNLNSLGGSAGGTGTVKDFEIGGITGITDPKLLAQVRAFCSSNVLVFALSPNDRMKSAQKQAANLAKATYAKNACLLTDSNDYSSTSSPKNKSIVRSSSYSTFGNVPAQFSPITSPYFYYRTFHNGVGILQRQNNVWAGFASHVLYQLPDYADVGASSGVNTPTNAASSKYAPGIAQVGYSSSSPSSQNNGKRPTRASLPPSASFSSTNSASSSPGPSASSSYVSIHSRNSGYLSDNTLSSSPSGVFSKFFSKLGLSRKNEPVSATNSNMPTSNRPRPLPTPGSPSSSHSSSKNSYRTVPKTNSQSYGTVSHTATRLISTPVVTMLEPAQPASSSSRPGGSSAKDGSDSGYSNTQLGNSVAVGPISRETLLEIQSSIKELSKSRMLVPDNKFVSQLMHMSQTALQLAIPKSLEYISNLASLHESYSSASYMPGSSGTTLEALLKGENLPFDSLAVQKNLDFTIRFHFATLTSRFLSPLSCYLAPSTSRQKSGLFSSHSSSSTGLGSMTKNVVGLVSSMAGLQRKNSHQESKRFEKRSEKRSSQRRSFDGRIGSSKNYPTMITSESIYSMALPTIKGSTHDVLGDDTSSSSSSSNTHNHTDTNKRSSAAHNGFSSVSNSLGRSKSPKVPTLSSADRKHNPVDFSGNASNPPAKRSSLPPLLTLSFDQEATVNNRNKSNNTNSGNPGAASNDNESEFFKEFHDFISTDIEDSSFSDADSSRQKPSSNSSVRLSGSSTSTATSFSSSTHQYQSLLLNTSGPGSSKFGGNSAKSPNLSIELSRLHFSPDNITPVTPSQMSMNSGNSSYNAGTDNPFSPATPVTPSTPVTPPSSYSSKRNNFEFFPQQNTLNTSNTNPVTSSSLRNVSTGQYRSSPGANSSHNTDTFDNSTNSFKRGKNVSFDGQVSIASTVTSSASSPAPSSASGYFTANSSPYPTTYNSPSSSKQHLNSNSPYRCTSSSSESTPKFAHMPNNSDRTMSLGLEVLHTDSIFDVVGDKKRTQRNSFTSNSNHNNNNNTASNSRPYLSDDHKSSSRSHLPASSNYTNSNSTPTPINTTPFLLDSGATHHSSSNTPVGSADFKKEDIYKEFMNNPNFANWLKMNHAESYN